MKLLEYIYIYIYRYPFIHPFNILIELKSLFIHIITNRYVLICVLKRVK